MGAQWLLKGLEEKWEGGGGGIEENPSKAGDFFSSVLYYYKRAMISVATIRAVRRSIPIRLL